MTTGLFFRYAFSSGDLTAPVIDPARVSNILPAGVEADAIGHWIFGGDAESLSDLITGVQVTPPATGAQPTFGANFMTIPDGQGRGLRTPFDEPAAVTMAMVIKAREEGDIQILGGTFTGADEDGGVTLMNRIGESRRYQVRERSSGVTLSFSIPSSIGAGDWVCIIGSAEPGERWGYGGVDPVSSVISRMVSTPVRKIALGNAYYTAGGSLAGLDVAEFVVWDRALTGAEMVDYRIRAVDRMRDRGVTLL